MGSCVSCARRKPTEFGDAISQSMSTLGSSLGHRTTGSMHASTISTLQLCECCRTPWSNDAGRLGPCGRCLVRQKERCSLIEELLQTEIVYNDHLVSLREGVQKPLDSSTLLTPAEHSKIFGEVKDLIYLSNRLIALVNDAVKLSIQQGDQHLERVEIGRILFKVLPHYSCYVPFVIKQSTNLQVLAELEATSEEFRLLLWEADIADIEFLKRLFSKPLLRVKRLPYFVDQILEKTPLSHPDRKSLQITQNKVNDLLKNIRKYSKKVERNTAKAPPKPRRSFRKIKMKKVKSPEEGFGNTFTKPRKPKPKSTNPFDSSSSSSSVESYTITDDPPATKPDSSPMEFVDSIILDKACQDLQKSIESLEAQTQHVPTLELNKGTKTELSVIEEQLIPCISPDSFNNSMRLSPRMSRSTILRPVSPVSPTTATRLSIWENRPSSPGIIEFISEKALRRQPEPSTSSEEYELASSTQTKLVVESQPESEAKPVKERPISDDFYFDERDFYEISDAEELSDSSDFDLRSKESDFDLSENDSIGAGPRMHQRITNIPSVEPIKEEKTLTRDTNDKNISTLV